jgi:hypothetical protein
LHFFLYNWFHWSFSSASVRWLIAICFHWYLVYQLQLQTNWKSISMGYHYHNWYILSQLSWYSSFFSCLEFCYYIFSFQKFPSIFSFQKFPSNWCQNKFEHWGR